MTLARTICLGFLLVISVGTLLLAMPLSLADGTWGNPLTALFTSTSAVCVTGLSVVDVGKYYSPFGQVILLLLFQIGGLGYMTATTFLMVLLGWRLRLRDKVALHRSLETPGMAGLRQLLKSIIAMTVVIELTGAFLLLPVFSRDFGFSQGLWFSLFHSVSAFNNAGFGLLSDNLMRYVETPIVSWTVGGLIIFGGIGYQVLLEGYLWLRDRQPQRRLFIFTLHTKLAVTITALLLVLGTLAIWGTEFRNTDTVAQLGYLNSWTAAWFQAVTARTAGFNTVDQMELTLTAVVVTIILMFIGASPGGTGGGIKTTTLGLLVFCTHAVLQGKTTVVCFQRRLPVAVVFKAVGITVGSLSAVMLGVILLSLANPNLNFIQILFEAVSAFGTVGLDLGVMATANAATQLILIGLMYTGRVGVLLLMSALLGDPRPSAIRYPEEELLVG
ncbi:TrkH family potassium uptake protein [Synechococcus elongatus]|uniref:TrkH family potassium uptake protein n=2 Tax=Synechococcus elongatus TaxID=32046 RepID=A0AAN1QNA3_SYNEL|nr:TrkH family potassium uptake protein [Synechococcus elongatus]AZB72426.1 ATPase [Synechococcus elongatus PCC 11801]